MDCPICLEELENDVINLSCEHGVHRQCYNDMVSKNIDNCPICRKSLYEIKIKDKKEVNNSSFLIFSLCMIGLLILLLLKTKKIEIVILPLSLLVTLKSLIE